MTKYRIIWRRPVLCQGLHYLLIRAPYSIRVWKSLKKKLCQQFTVLHIALLPQLDAQSPPTKERLKGDDVSP